MTNQRNILTKVYKSGHYFFNRRCICYHLICNTCNRNNIVRNYLGWSHQFVKYFFYLTFLYINSPNLYNFTLHRMSACCFYIYNNILIHLNLLLVLSLSRILIFYCTSPSINCKPVNYVSI